jgi:hypothetical protein
MIYLIGRTGTGTIEDAFRQAVDFQPGQIGFSLVPDSTRVEGHYLVDLPVPINDPRAIPVADGPTDRLTDSAMIALGNRVIGGRTNARLFPDVVRELLHVRHPRGGLAPAHYDRGRVAYREIVMGRLPNGLPRILWREEVAPTKHSVGYTETFPGSGTDITDTSLDMDWDQIADQFGAGGSAATESWNSGRLTNTHATANLDILTDIGFIADSDDNEISSSAQIPTSGNNAGIYLLARVNSAGHTGYYSYFDRRSGTQRQRAGYASSGALNVLDDNGADAGAGVVTFGVSCNGSSITFTRPGSDYGPVTDTNVASGRYGSIFISGGISSVTGELVGPLTWQDVGYTPPAAGTLLRAKTDLHGLGGIMAFNPDLS